LNLRPSTRATLAIAVVVIVVAAGAYVILGSPTRSNVQSVPSQFTINGRSFGITYVATDDAEWQAGLMDKKITNSTTMLFIFPSMAVYPFWMYHVNSSLDIIWLDVTGNSGRVVYIAADLPGCTGLEFICPNYNPSAAANYVIEAQGGFSAEYGVVVGTTVEFH